MNEISGIIGKEGGILDRIENHFPIIEKMQGRIELEHPGCPDCR
jgi:hypothetical protein